MTIRAVSGAVLGLVLGFLWTSPARAQDKPKFYPCPVFARAELGAQERLDFLFKDYKDAQARLAAAKQEIERKLNEARIKGTQELFKRRYGLMSEGVDAMEDPKAASASESAESMILVGLANVLVARAKEEARIWAFEQAKQNLCGTADSYAPLFPNSCAMLATGDIPGPSIATMALMFRRDLYSAPACTTWLTDQNEACLVSGACIANDKAPDMRHRGWDFYVAQAFLAHAYRLELTRKSKDAELPGHLKNLPAVATAVDADQLGNWLLAYMFHPFNDRIRDAAKKAYDSVQQGARDATAIEQELQRIITDMDLASVVTAGEALRVGKVSTMQIAALMLAKLPPEQSERLRAGFDAYLAASRGEYTSVAASSAIALGCVETQSDVLRNACRTIPLLADVAEADTQEKMDSALDRVLSPAAQYRFKQRESRASLGAMVGVAYGHERLEGAGGEASHGGGGAFLPVGLDLSWSMNWSVFGHGSVFFSVLDIGALASFGESEQIGTGTSSSSPNAKGSSVVSPGAYLTFGFRDSPFRIGAGYSTVPELRSIALAGGAATDADATRILGFVAVDLSFFSR